MELTISGLIRSSRARRVAKDLLILYMLCGLLFTACRPANPLVGKWRTEPPSSLLYDYKADGTVLLLMPDAVYQVFHYKMVDQDTIMLIDGMGRIKQYNFEVSGDRMTYFDPDNPGVAVERFSHQE